MKKHTQDELELIVKNHKLWMSSQAGGKYADLSSADLSSADLSSADLSSADLSSANLRNADLSSAVLDIAVLDIAVARLDFGGWSICVRHDETSIGCITHKNTGWLKWSPEDVRSFDKDASSWWDTHGECIKSVIRSVMKKHEAIESNKNKENNSH